MKKLILTLAVVMAAHTAFAAEQTVESLSELCALESISPDDGALYEANFTELADLDVTTAAMISATELNAINQHLLHQEFTPAPLTFKEIQDLFTTGDYSSAGLDILTFQSKSSGQVYKQVITWAGDNPHGIIFDSSLKMIVAYNEDDSIYLNTSTGVVSCYDLSKDK